MAGILVEQASCTVSIAGLQVPAPLISGVVWRDASMRSHVHPHLPAIRQSNLSSVARSAAPALTHFDPCTTLRALTGITQHLPRVEHKCDVCEALVC
jgi:hypothetical protein